MNSEPIPGQGSSALPIAGATLQAVLQLSDGGMDSIAVPVPLPEMVIRVQVGTAGETRFRRARSADSVVRYAQEGSTLADGATTASGAAIRQCGRCGASRAIYYVPKLPPNESATPATLAYCDTCYPKAGA